MEKEKAGGRPKDEVWQHVTPLEGGRRVKCNYCEFEFAGGASRIKAHINKGKNIRPCPNFPQPHTFGSDTENSSRLKDNFLQSQENSADALLERTITQSVTKHADKLKQTGDSKIIHREDGLLLKNNFEGGATWAYEVGSQSMVCPIIVEDLNPPRQMLVQMLCEERGFFLEIADFLRGMGFTILKGEMEAQNDKIWARFAVEANRDVTRMEIFMSLVLLLEQTAKEGGGGASTSKENSTDVHPQGVSLDSLIDHGENENLQKMKRYVFERLRSEDLVYISPLSYLTREEFITLKPEAHLDSLVIDAFIEILTHTERKKAMPSNWYLPVAFSDAALKGNLGHFLKFVHCQKMKEHYMSDLNLCEKIFIPVHVGARPNGGHFYLYIIHLKKKEIEIWDSLPNAFEAEIKETTENLLFALEKLFKEVPFTTFHRKMANGILTQPNGFDCGIFVINYMQQSDNYVNKDRPFKFDSQREREGLAFKLVDNDLNQEKQNLYDKARQHYAQVEKQDGNKRLRVDTSIENSEGVGKEREAEYDDSDEEDGAHDEDVDFDEEDGLENDLIGWNFRRYTDQIMEWIKDEKVSAIGVWGGAGLGKTALASHIYDKLLEGDYKVIWVTVSQNSIHKLQKVIAKSIKLDISYESEDKIIARKIFQAFKEMKKCVIILDDVWDHFFLKEVGFPMSGHQMKLLFTTRIWEVCQGMGCEGNKIDVKFLCKDDCWALFKKTMGSYKEMSLEVKKIARKVAYKCKGFPLAIVRIATSMKGKKQVGEWSHMLECVENWQYEMDKWILPVLRCSYDFLTNKLQGFFLYWALSTKGSFSGEKANHLIRRFVYESIDKTKKLRVQYGEGYNMLERLKNHSMLEQYYWSPRVNKFLRALAIHIAKDTSKIMANTSKNYLTKIPSDDEWREDLQKVFLTGNKIQAIPDGTCPRCYQLTSLLLDDNKSLNYISDDFFNNMPALKILDLSRTRIKRLPESVSNLKYLTALLLSWCDKLSYIPSLSTLKQLISLDLSGTAITEAPVGLDSLINLRCLNILGTDVLMSASLISKLINLEHLLAQEVIAPKVTATGIQGVYKLEVIVAHFKDINIFNTCVSFLEQNCELKSFDLTLMDENYNYNYDLEEINIKYRDYYSSSMKRIRFWSMDLGNRKAVLPTDMKELFINDCQRVGTVGNCLCGVVPLYGPNNNNPHQIESLNIIAFKGVKYLCCLSAHCPFCSSAQLVRRLYLSGLEDLTDMVSPNALLPLHESSLFCHLTQLEIWNCDNMETLMTPKLLELLQNLRTISVSSCEKTKEIVGEYHSGKEVTGSGDLMTGVHNHVSHPIPITLPKLTSLELFFMDQLNFVYRGIMLCPSLHRFSAYYCTELRELPQMQISDGSVIPIKGTSSFYHWQK